MIKRLNRNEMAQRLAKDIPSNSYVNIGIGMPELVASYLDPRQDIILHSENGILGMGPPAELGQEDQDLINAGKKPVTLLKGGSFFQHLDSFAIMRGGHLDLCIMGGMQVSENGDLANWSLGRCGEPPAVGGAMDLAVGAKRVFILMEHNAKDGSPKLLKRCTLPLTGVGVVSRIYTDLAVLDVTKHGLKVIGLNTGVSFADLQLLTEAHIYEE